MYISIKYIPILFKNFILINVWFIVVESAETYLWLYEEGYVVIIRIFRKGYLYYKYVNLCEIFQSFVVDFSGLFFCWLHNIPNIHILYTYIVVNHWPLCIMSILLCSYITIWSNGTFVMRPWTNIAWKECDKRTFKG